MPTRSLKIDDMQSTKEDYCGTGCQTAALAESVVGAGRNPMDLFLFMTAPDPKQTDTAL